jgi:hypothetical protein
LALSLLSRAIGEGRVKLKYSVVTNKDIADSQQHVDPVFRYIIKSFADLTEAERFANQVRSDHLGIRVAILNHELQQIVEIC